MVGTETWASPEETWPNLSNGPQSHLKGWASPAGFSKYEVSNDGFGPDQRPVRSIPRTVGARRLKGVPLAVRVGSSGYLEVKVYDDDGKQQTRTVHSLVLAAHAGPCPEGMECRHLDDDPFNNVWRPGTEEETRAAGGNLIWGTRAENAEDKYRNGNRTRPAPRFCAVCGATGMTPGSKRCPECVAAVAAVADARRTGLTADDVATALAAVTQGGYVTFRPSVLQRVNATLRVRRPRANRNAS